MNDINIYGFICFMVFVGILIGVLISLAVPWLWQLVKPILHALTA